MEALVFPGGSLVKNLPASAGTAGDLSLIPGLGNGNPLQDSCLENPKDRGAWRAIVHRVTKGWTRLNENTWRAYLVPGTGPINAQLRM